ncbi:glycosyltransferase family 4 protein [Aneurinibacillus sp. Ricciae_BoGa-3]|uniref:glycosyltransferase family 4 protein n=1 Tax=Aneurinibacillus sp. Ricciae_BoGa-3 TaxID=3022697 RepID=UPI00234087B2|nr:glycosyltransferase family 4 protein [Aneurinibacillus sp. Ricciae_BoGa-3]WCK56389.1 glycosyltransferase family 4 protein [Aneurinibacillus sp. Ricciae_BoGa-3]
MNILIIAPSIYTVSAGTGSSVEISIYQIAKQTAKYHNVTIFSRKRNNLPKISTNDNLKIVRVTGKDNYLEKAVSYASRHKYDCIQIENRPRYVLSLRNKFPSTPLILVLHSYVYMNELDRIEKDKVLQAADAIICNSSFLMKTYVQEFPAYTDKFHYFHLGVDTKRFTPPTRRQKQKMIANTLPKRSYNVLYTGRIVPGKGIHILIRALGQVRKKHRAVRLLVVGPCISQKYKTRLHHEAQKAEVQVQFIKTVKPSAMHQIYWLAHCFVCPTQLPEAFGLVNVEAMASGLPVIASKRGGIPEIINEDCGILIEDYKNPEAFAKAILKLIVSPNLADSLARNGRALALQKFDWVKTAKRYIEFYTYISNSRVQNVLH